MLKFKIPKIKQIVPRVFVVTMDNQFDLAMTFCRYQEFYESPDMSGKRFTFVEFMRYYANKWGNPKGSFSYTEDWNGFNIPGQKIRDCIFSHFESNKAGDQNEYDTLMFNLISRILKRNGSWNFYLIGVHTEKNKREREALVAHEVAHGLYYMNESYRNKVNVLLRQLTKSTKSYMLKALYEKGYTRKTALDEINSFLSTGLVNNMKPKKVRKEMRIFLKLLKEYYPKAVVWNDR